MWYFAGGKATSLGDRLTNTSAGPFKTEDGQPPSDFAIGE